ncbi:hypothetical protein Glove_87g257 [Diversispora epigaea]|uniref:Uncharacterized protein n=1 Tax=Diversispora epigaea TaxID=1348612 RepID=A0A397JFN6_9GLOM|nr:hypothetical protein Glove_87g257 [Diversispora epigaea]
MQTTKKFQNQNQDLKNQKIDPNDPFGIGLVPYHPNLITFEYTGEENLLLDFVEPVYSQKYTTKCCFLNDSNNDEDDNDSFFEFISDGEDFYECYNCKRAKYEEKKRRQGEKVERKRRN